MDDFPDKRMMKDVTRERTMMVPKPRRPGEETLFSGPGKATNREQRLVPEFTSRMIKDLNRGTVHQSGKDFANRRMVEVNRNAPADFVHSPVAYDKKFYQTGTARGAHSDNAVDILGMNREGALNRLVQSQAQNLRGEGIGSPATALMGTVLGGTLGEAYDETFGEGDTRYMDPSGEQRMAARQAGAKMPASAGRAIRQVLEEREQQGPGLYQNLGQELPAVGPLFAFDPYQGY